MVSIRKDSTCARATKYTFVHLRIGIERSVNFSTVVLAIFLVDEEHRDAHNYCDDHKTSDGQAYSQADIRLQDKRVREMVRE